MAKNNIRKWPFTTKTSHKIIVEAPTFKIAKEVLIEIKKEYI